MKSKSQRERWEEKKRNLNIMCKKRFRKRKKKGSCEAKLNSSPKRIVSFLNRWNRDVEKANLEENIDFVLQSRVTNSLYTIVIFYLTILTPF